MMKGSIFHEMILQYYHGRPPLDSWAKELGYEFGAVERAALEATEILRAIAPDSVLLEWEGIRDYEQGRLVGRLDVFVPSQGLVIDWKLGAGALDSLQAHIYAALLGKPVRVEFWIFVVSRNQWKTETVQVSQDDILYVEEALIKPGLHLVQQIVNAGLIPPSNPAACRNCWYFTCPTRRKNAIPTSNG